MASPSSSPSFDPPKPLRRSRRNITAPTPNAPDTLCMLVLNWRGFWYVLYFFSTPPKIARFMRGQEYPATAWKAHVSQLEYSPELCAALPTSWVTNANPYVQGVQDLHVYLRELVAGISPPEPESAAASAAAAAHSSAAADPPPTYSWQPPESAAAAAAHLRAGPRAVPDGKHARNVAEAAMNIVSNNTAVMSPGDIAADYARQKQEVLAFIRQAISNFQLLKQKFAGNARAARARSSQVHFSLWLGDDFFGQARMKDGKEYVFPLPIAKQDPGILSYVKFGRRTRVDLEQEALAGSAGRTLLSPRELMKEIIDRPDIKLVHAVLQFDKAAGRAASNNYNRSRSQSTPS